MGDGNDEFYVDVSMGMEGDLMGDGTLGDGRRKIMSPTIDVNTKSRYHDRQAAGVAAAWKYELMHSEASIARRCFIRLEWIAQAGREDF